MINLVSPKNVTLSNSDMKSSFQKGKKDNEIAKHKHEMSDCDAFIKNMKKTGTALGCNVA